MSRQLQTALALAHATLKQITQNGADHDRCYTELTALRPSFNQLQLADTGMTLSQLDSPSGALMSVISLFEDE